MNGAIFSQQSAKSFKIKSWIKMSFLSNQFVKLRGKIVSVLKNLALKANRSLAKLGYNQLGSCLLPTGCAMSKSSNLAGENLTGKIAEKADQIWWSKALFSRCDSQVKSAELQISKIK